VGQTVYVVDDEKQIANVVSFVLREAELDVETFYNRTLTMIRMNRDSGDCVRAVSW
jgi:FixJ family two-component response regulator